MDFDTHTSQIKNTYMLFQFPYTSKSWNTSENSSLFKNTSTKMAKDEKTVIQEKHMPRNNSHPGKETRTPDSHWMKTHKPQQTPPKWVWPSGMRQQQRACPQGEWHETATKGLPSRSNQTKAKSSKLGAIRYLKIGLTNNRKNYENDAKKNHQLCNYWHVSK